MSFKLPPALRILYLVQKLNVGILVSCEAHAKQLLALITKATNIHYSLVLSSGPNPDHHPAPHPAPLTPSYPHPAL